jgi:predicted CXXCH cytochrome family protein
MTRHPGWALAGLFVVVAIPSARWAAGQRRAAEQRGDELARTVPQATRPGYSTSQRCEACHPSQYASWHRGYHRSMTTYASPETVRGNFDHVHLAGGGYEVNLSRRGDEFYVDMIDPQYQYEVDFGQRAPEQLAPRVERRVSLVTGSHHMQAYWVPSNLDNGQFSVPFTYLFDDQRWVSRADVFLHPPDERQQVQVWNVSCITCHSTAGQPLTGERGAESRVGEMGIACEACHGPAEEHIAANQNPIRRYLEHLRGGGDSTIVNPARLDPKRGSQVCGQCHALTDLSDEIYRGVGKTYVAGDDLERTQPLLSPLHPSPQLARYVAEDSNYLRGYFWADGTVRVSSRDYTGMMESKCMQGGLGCTSCHSLHESDPSMLVAAGKDGDGACTGCHAKIDASHSHHRAGSEGAKCMSCHMPYTVYGLLKGIRNHRIDSPHVTGKTGGDERPNACNLCHVDRSLAWSAKYLADWYKQPVAPGLSDRPAAVEWMLTGDAVQRAIAAWQFGWQGARAAAKVDDLVPYLVAALDDPYAAVRYVAGHALKNLDPANEFDYLAAPEERRRAADAILQRWRAKHPGAAVPSVDELVQERDNTPVRAME